MARAARADHLDAGTYLTEGKRLYRVLADTQDGVEAENQVEPFAVIMLTLVSIKKYWRVVTPAESADA